MFESGFGTIHVAASKQIKGAAIFRKNRNFSAPLSG